MQRRKFSREYKLEAVKLVNERGVAVAQAARDLDAKTAHRHRKPYSVFPGL
jgi:transposase-like protein